MFKKQWVLILDTDLLLIQIILVVLHYKTERDCGKQCFCGLKIPSGWKRTCYQHSVKSVQNKEDFPFYIKITVGWSSSTNQWKYGWVDRNWLIFHVLTSSISHVFTQHCNDVLVDRPFIKGKLMACRLLTETNLPLGK